MILSDEKFIRRSLSDYTENNADSVYYIKSDFCYIYLDLAIELMIKTHDKKELFIIDEPHLFNGLCSKIYKGDTICMWIYEPGGGFHVISNDAVSAWNTFIYYAFTKRKKFETYIEVVNINCEWAKSEDLVQLFITTIGEGMDKVKYN